jgi:putative transposase
MIKEIYVMTAPKSPDRARFLREQLKAANPDLLRDMVKTFADALMSAEADGDPVPRMAGGGPRP